MDGSMLGCLFGCMRRTRSFTEKIGANPQQLDGTIGGEGTDKGVTAVHRYFIDVVALVGVASSVATMVFTTGHLVDIASFTTMLFAPYAGLQKHKLEALGGFRGQQNILRSNVNELQTQNNQLHSSLNQLESNVMDLQQVEGELESIATKARTNVTQLQHIVKENKRINQEIKKNLQAQIIQSLVDVVLTTDKNHDNTIGPREIDMLVIRMNAMPGFDFDQQNFLKAIGGRSTKVGLNDVMAIIRNLNDDNVPEDENIFHMKPKQILKKR